MRNLKPDKQRALDLLAAVREKYHDKPLSLRKTCRALQLPYQSTRLLLMERDPELYEFFRKNWNKSNISDEEILGDVARYKSSWAYKNADTIVSLQTVITRFGSWLEAKKQAGDDHD